MNKNEKMGINVSKKNLKFLLTGIEYNSKMLKDILGLIEFIKKSSDKIKISTSEMSFNSYFIYNNKIFLNNMYIESSLMLIRKLYEFYFKYEIMEKRGRDFTKYLNKNNRTDALAEDYFNDYSDWKKIKKENEISFDKLEEFISWKDLNKQAFHFTYCGKTSWKIENTINCLLVVNKTFCENKNK